MGLTNTLQEIADQLNTDIPDIRASIKDPPAQISAFPVTVVYSGGATYDGFPTGTLVEHHTVMVDLIVNAVDLQRSLAKLDEMANKVPACLFKRFRDHTFTTFQALNGSITCQLVTRQWGGVDVLIYRYTATVKLQAALV